MSTDKKDAVLDYYTRENVSDQEIVLKITLPQESFTKSYEQLLSDQIKNTNLKGFRKGGVPKDLIEKDLKPALLYETFERIAPYYVNGAIIQEKLQPIAPPAYTDLGDLDTNKPIVFSVKITVMPEFKLGNIKKIKVELKDAKATKEEIDNTIKTMFDNNQASVKAEKIDDAWAKQIGEFYRFDEVKDLKGLEDVVVKAIEGQKKSIVEAERTSEAVKEAISLSKIVIPESAIAFEAQQREEAFLNDIKQMGTTPEEFCSRQNITMEELKDRWMKDSKEALENDILFRIYAEDRKIEVSPEEVTAEIDKIKNAAKAREGNDFDELGYDDPNWIENVKSFVLKQKAYDAFLKEVLGIEKEVHNHDHSDHDHNHDHSHDEKETEEKSKAKKSEETTDSSSEASAKEEEKETKKKESNK